MAIMSNDLLLNTFLKSLLQDKICDSKESS